MRTVSHFTHAIAIGMHASSISASPPIHMIAPPRWMLERIDDVVEPTRGHGGVARGTGVCDDIDERESGEGVDRHRRHHVDESKSAVDRRAALEAEGDAKEEVAHDEEADLFEVVHPLVFHHEIEQSGQVRDGDEDEVGREAEERLGDQPS